MTMFQTLQTALQNQECRDVLAFEFGLRDDQLDRWGRRLSARVGDSLAWAGLADCEPGQVVQQILLMYGGVV